MISHLADHFEDLREIWDQLDDEDRPSLGEADEEDEEKRAESDIVDEEMIERTTLRWLDTPDNNGITPREATQTLEGREELCETIKSIEYLADETLDQGEDHPCASISSAGNWGSNRQHNRTSPCPF